MKIILTERQLDLINKNIIKERSERPKDEDKIRDFQNWVIDTQGDKKILGNYGADGDWGPNTRAAWNKYSASYSGTEKKGPKKEYPFDVLSKNPQPKDIAAIIKKSNGGWFRNDYEDWAEAAFNKILNIERYRKVTSLLGKDVYKYIKEYMNTSKIHYNGPSIDTTYKNLVGKKKNEGTSWSTILKNKTDIEKFQTYAAQQGFKNVRGRKKGQIITVDGRWGSNSQAAWDQHGSSYDPKKAPVVNDLENDKLKEIGTGGFALPFAFPEYEPSCDGNSTWDLTLCKISEILSGSDNPIFNKAKTYGRLGHAGIALVTKTGDVQVFEFGRYSGANTGGGITKRKNLGKIATVSNGKITNLEDVQNKVHKNTQASGPNNKIEFVTLRVPDVEAGIEYAKSVTKEDYRAFDFSLTDDSKNCATFVSEVVIKCGVPMPIITSPDPKSMISKMKYISEPSFLKYLVA